MGLREMQDMELQLRVRRGQSPFADQERLNCGMGLRPMGLLLATTLSALLWGALGFVIWYGPRALAQIGLWLSR